MLAAMELPIIVHSIATADPLDSDAAERLYTRCVLALLRLLAAAADRQDRHVLAAVATVHLLELALLGYEARIAHSPPVCTARQRRTPIAPAISGPSPLSILPSPARRPYRSSHRPASPAPMSPLCPAYPPSLPCAAAGVRLARQLDPRRPTSRSQRLAAHDGHERCRPRRRRRRRPSAASKVRLSESRLGACLGGDK